MIAPAAEQRRLLSRTERAGLWLAEFCGRRLRGLENVRGLPMDSSLLFVANQRSFFDFFTVVVALRLKAGFRHRMYFPVRSEFFYDHPLGLLVNLLGAGMSMFPPIFRTGPKRALNVWSLARCAEELAKPGTAVGFHPEGTRNQGPDPFILQPAHSGPGRIALAVPRARVVPVFVVGLGNRILAEVGHNLSAPQRHPVWMAFGPEVDLTDLREERGREGAQEAAERCRTAIRLLAEAVQRDVERPDVEGPVDPEGAGELVSRKPE